MRELFNFKKKNFAVYGLGKTGKSAINFLKKNKANDIYKWDDYSEKFDKKLKNNFQTNLNIADYIIVSPGINIYKSQFKKLLIKNKKKIITDLDLFF